MSLFAYQLAKRGRPITLENRNVKIVNGIPTEVFTTFANVSAIVCTVRGVRVFDDTNIDTDVTHDIRLDFIAGVTSETWVKLGTRRIKILTHENCCENDEILILMCTDRGEDVKKVNEA